MPRARQQIAAAAIQTHHFVTELSANNLGGRLAELFILRPEEAPLGEALLHLRLRRLMKCSASRPRKTDVIE